MAAGLFVGIGVGKYEHGLKALDHAVSDVVGFHELLGGGFAGEPLANPHEDDVRRHLKTLKQSTTGPLVFLWSGHGIASPAGGLRVLASDSGDDPTEGLSVDDLVAACAISGAHQLLFLVDTCFSGAALPAGTVATEILRLVPPEGHPVWVGVLASCLAEETARDGVFGQRIRDLLEEGPATPELRLRWSPHNQFLRGDDFCDALLKEWDGAQQSLDFQTRGNAWWMLPNPLYDPGAPEQVVEHLLQAARGGAAVGEHSWFTGRTHEVDTVVDWVQSGTPGIHVVTGSAGTGKSAIVGRVVSLSNPDERARLYGEGRTWEHRDPNEGSVHAHLHARGLTADRAAAVLADQLVRHGVLTPQTDPRNANELMGQLQRAVEDGADAPVIVVDGLDEARTEAFAIADELLLRLARHAIVIVATRDMATGDGPSLVDRLTVDGELLDLDDPEVQSRGRGDLRDYLVARLHGVDARMDAQSVAALFAETTSMTESRPFLLARLVSDQLRSAPIDTDSASWQDGVRRSIEAAFDADLAALSAAAATDPDLRRTTNDARALLSALAWAFGAGFPEEEWLAAANALSQPTPGFGREDATWVLHALGRYIIQDGEGGVAVYRLAHQSLADHLRPPFPQSPKQPFDQRSLPLVVALLDRYRVLLDGGLAATTPVYLWRYAWRHAAAAGPAGLDSLRELAAEESALLPDVALAALEVADQLAFWGLRQEAVPFVEDAVELYHDQAAADPLYLPQLAGALDNLGMRYSGVGRREDAVPAAEEAVRLRRDQADANPAYLPDLAGSLNNLGIRYSGIGRRAEAVPVTEEAVALYRDQAGTNPAYLPNLAAALNNLGVLYKGVGRPDDAVPVTEEAVMLRRRQTAASPNYAPSLAGALNNLGLRYSEVGRRDDAVPVAEESAALYREQAATNPAYLPELAGALTNLGIRYSDVGRRAEAVPVIEEAVALYREQAATNPAYLPDLAGALNNLGILYSGVGRSDDAVSITEEALALRRQQAATNPAYLPDLAGALTNLGIRYSRIGRRDEAISVTEEAVGLYREQAASSPAYLPDLAAALNNLGVLYEGVGRHEAAVPVTEEAVALRRQQAAANPAYLPDLAGSLNNLGVRYSDVGRHDEATAVAEEAAALRREQAAANPAYLPELAGSLNNLGVRYSDVGRHDEAVAVAEEAVALRREQADADPVYLPDLAAALINAGLCYGEAGRHEAAIPVTAEAVALYRQQADASPAFLADLASALNNLGVSYSQIGREEQAIPPTEEAVTLYCGQVNGNPRYLPDLAAALRNLDASCRAAGRLETADRLWRDSIAAVPGDPAAILLLNRAKTAPQGHPAVVEWLVEALRQTDDRLLVSACHDEARRHRMADPPGFDAGWAAAGAREVPGWLTVAEPSLALAREWLATPTYTAECHYLEAHSELLGDGLDLAVDEAVLALPEDAAARYRSLREAARADGVEAAYRPLMLVDLAHEFVSASVQERRALLAERLDDLLTDEVADVVGGLAASDDPSQSLLASQAQAVLELARIGEASAALAAIEDPGRFPDLLRTFATRSDADALAPAAVLALAVSSTEPDAATAMFFLACAAAIRGQDDALELLGEAVDADAGQADRWIATLAEIAREHAEAVTLIAPLARLMSEHEQAPPSQASDASTGA